MIIKSAVDSSLGYSPHIPPYFFIILSSDMLPFILHNIVCGSHRRCDCSYSMLFPLQYARLPSDDKDFILPILVHDMMSWFGYCIFNAISVV